MVFLKVSVTKEGLGVKSGPHWVFFPQVSTLHAE